MEIQDLLSQLGQELKKQQDNNDSRINYLCNENQKLKNNLSTFKQNLIDLVGIINRIANEIDDF